MDVIQKIIYLINPGGIDTDTADPGVGIMQENIAYHIKTEDDFFLIQE